MATVEQLADHVKELEARLMEAGKIIDEQKKQATAHVPTVPTVIVHTTQEKKMTKYSEKEDIDEWCESVKNHHAMKKMDHERDRVNFIIDHLTEYPKQTLMVQIDRRKATSKEMFDILKDAYETKSPCSNSRKSSLKQIKGTAQSENIHKSSLINY